MRRVRIRGSTTGAGAAGLSQWGGCRIAKWVIVLAALYFGGTEAETLGFPAPHLFEALVVGLVLSLGGLTKLQMPAWLYAGGQAITGVVLGTYVSWSSLRSFRGELAIDCVVAAVIVIEIAVGLLFASRRLLVSP
jgi:uncharacterized membrane protein AbrB (regulator of aidB expression)